MANTKLLTENQRERLRGQALAQTLTRVGRMLTNLPTFKVNYGSGQYNPYNGYGNMGGRENTGMQAPCTTTTHMGRTELTFNPTLVPLANTDDYVRAVGLFYHQIGHGLFTVQPRWLLNTGVTDPTFNAYNLLEDQRVEVLMHAMYPSVAPYLVADVVKYVLESTQQTPGRDPNPLFNAYARIVGVDYLPADLIRRARQSWVDKPGSFDYVEDQGQRVTRTYEQAADRLAELVAEYQSLVMPDENRSWTIAKVYANILTQSGASTTSQHGTEQPGGEDSKGGRGGGNSQSRERQKQAQQQRDEDKNGQGEGQGEKGEKGEQGQGSGEGQGEEKSDQKGQGQGQGEGDQPGEGQGQGSGQGEGGEDGEGQGNGGALESNDNQGNGDQGQAATLGGQGAGTGGYKSDENWYADEITGRASLQSALENLLDSAGSEMAAGVSRLRNSTRRLPDYSPQNKRTAKPETITDATKYAKNIKRLTADVEPGWDARKDSGRLNTQRAMSGEVPLDELFDRWDDGKVDDSRVETVVLVDTSGSMMHSLQAVVESAWAVKRAGDELRHPVTVVLFGSYSRVLFTPDEKVSRSQVPTVDSGGGTDPLDAIQYAANVFEQSNLKHRVLITLTDGAWSNTTECDNLISKMNKAGIVTGLVNYTSNGYGGGMGKHKHQVVVGSSSDTAVGDLAKKLATQAVKRTVSS